MSRKASSSGRIIWSDKRIATGELWDDEIKQRIAESHIALLLVSQPFLDSAYCQNVEIPAFLQQECHIFPIILSPCEWKRHDWLSSRQFIPVGDQTIEEHYTNPGKRKRLFLNIRQQLHEKAEATRMQLYRQGSMTLPPNPFTETGPIRDSTRFIGREAELRRLQNLLQGGSVSLLGDPKIGKSSLLWSLRDAWQGEVLGPVSLHGVEDQEDFLDQVAQTLEIKSNDWRAIRDNLRKREALLLLDELDTGLEYEVTDIELGRFRAICYNNPRLKMVVASRRSLTEIFSTPKKGSNPYDFLTPFQVNRLSENEARLYLKHSWSPKAPAFTEESIKSLLQETQCYPFKLQQAAFHCYESLGDPGYDWKTLWKQSLKYAL